MRLLLADAGALLQAARRTAALRFALALAAAGLLAAAVAVADRHDAGRPPLAEPGRTTVLVLDVSSSIQPSRYGQIDDTIERAVSEGGRFGVVLFSDIAYELLPPGTRADELTGLRRFFRPLPGGRAGPNDVDVGGTRFPQAPWSEVFSSGTRISTGLRVAAEMLARERLRNGKVVLVSDLEEEYEDLAALGRVLAAYADARLPLRVVGLASKPEDERVFRRLVGEDAVERARPHRSNERASAGVPGEPLPLALVALGLALALALATNEHLLARLPLRQGEGRP